MIKRLNQHKSADNTAFIAFRGLHTLNMDMNVNNFGLLAICSNRSFQGARMKQHAISVVLDFIVDFFFPLINTSSNISIHS